MAGNSALADTADNIEISDDEGLVDRKTKEHILNLRVQIDADERELFVNKATDPAINLSHQEATRYWAVSVRQYLRGIKRLWNDEEEAEINLSRIDHYWEDKLIGEYTLIPPDKAGYQFSRIAEQGVTEATLRRAFDLPPDADVPKPQTVTFRGLQSILDRDYISHTWTVYTSKRGSPPNWEQVVLRTESGLPKQLLDEAVEAADNFLQQAGLGFDVQLPAYTGGDEPGI